MFLLPVKLIQKSIAYCSASVLQVLPMSVFQNSEQQHRKKRTTIPRMTQFLFVLMQHCIRGLTTANNSTHLISEGANQMCPLTISSTLGLRRVDHNMRFKRRAGCEKDIFTRLSVINSEKIIIVQILICIVKAVWHYLFDGVILNRLKSVPAHNKWLYVLSCSLIDI